MDIFNLKTEVNKSPTASQIYTISAPKLFNYFAKTSGSTSPYSIDTRKYYYFCQVLKQTAEFDECPLYHQILYSNQVKKEQVDTGKSDWLLDKLIIIDFEYIFSQSQSDDASVIGKKNKLLDKAKDLIENGLDIQFTDDKIIHMQPFDKSGNMSRESKITFINKEYYAELTNRLNLGMDFSKIPVVLSKYYAYRGLYLTTSQRVEDNRIKITPETIIIMRDRTDDLVGSAVDKGNMVETATPGSLDKNTNRRKWNFHIMEEVQTKKIDTPYDGQGFITKDYSQYINKDLHIEGASSYQIRLPFVKGMLHQVDVQKFLSDLDPEGMKKASYDYIDAFGYKRDLKKAKIFLTESMFKGMKWLKTYCEKKKIEDPMVFYCNALKKYRHALYISGTDLPYGRGSYTHLSYQMLNTLDLTDQQFDNIVDIQKNFIENPKSFLKEYDGVEVSDDTENMEEEQINISVPFWKKALLEENSLEKDVYIKSQLKNIQKSIITKMVTGKLLVEGQTRYLCRDLLPLLYMLLDREEISPKEYYSFLWMKTYLPMGKDTQKTILEKVNIGYRDYIAFFRSPHLSRNEECVLQPFVLPKDKADFIPVKPRAFNNESDEEIASWVSYEAYKNNLDMYQKYFGHLTGIAMVPRGSIVPLCLGGADFDGDLVNVVVNQDVVNAVRQGCYDGWMKRTIPVIKIPDTKSVPEVVPSGVPYAHLRNTFSNQIGFLSNTAIAIGQKEYGKNMGSFDKNKLTCSVCTILTGLEIDAVKNGIHPSLDIIKDNSDDIPKAFYLEFLSGYKKLKANPKFKFDQMLIEDIVEKNEETDHEEHFIKIKVNDCKEVPTFPLSTAGGSGTKINQLPLNFMNLYNNSYKNVPKSKGKRSRSLFRAADCDKKLRRDEMNRFEKECSEVIEVYIFYKDLIKRLNGEKNKEGYGESNLSKLILKIYDGEQAGKIHQELLPQLIEKIHAMIPSNVIWKDVTERVNDSNWQFQTNDEEKCNALKKIIGEGFKPENLTEEEKNFLFHFGQQGYKLLWHLLQSIKQMSRPFDNVYAEYVQKKEYENKAEAFCQNAKELDGQLYEDAKMYYEKNTMNINKKSQEKCMDMLRKTIRQFDELERPTIIYLLHKVTKGAEGKREFFWKLFE